MRFVVPLLALVLVGGCGSEKKSAPRFDRAELIRCLRAGGYSFVNAGGGVVRLNVSGEKKYATLAEVDVAFGKDAREALARLRANFFFKNRPKAKPFVHGRYVGNVAYAITTLPFVKGGKALDEARARVGATAKRLVEGCLTRSRSRS